MKMFTTGVACLAYGLAQHNELVRCSVAHAGNDHRLGAQEAPPAIISLYPGTGFEQHVDALIAGTAELDTYKAEKKLAAPGCASAAPVETNVEDRNRTAPFPFCGNRFEFRACGSSQNCAFPILACNAVMAAGFAALTKLVEGGKSHKEAVAQLFKDNRHVIFTGNGYSAEWPVEAKKRGLPNLNTTPLAIPEFASAKNKQLFKDLQIYAEDDAPPPSVGDGRRRLVRACGPKTKPPERTPPGPVCVNHIAPRRLSPCCGSPRAGGARRRFRRSVRRGRRARGRRGGAGRPSSRRPGRRSTGGGRSTGPARRPRRSRR